MFNLLLRNNDFDLLDFADSIFNDNAYDGVHTEYPYIQLYENETSILAKAALPGLKKEDLDIQIHNNILTIEGEKKSDYSDVKYLRKERSFGKFKKQIKLNTAIDSNRINAQLKDGMLTVELAKSEDAGVKKIEIG